MKLVMHTSIFSIVFAGVLASALTTKTTTPVSASHSLVVSFAMPVPNCDPNTGCPNAMPGRIATPTPVALTSAGGGTKGRPRQYPNYALIAQKCQL